MHVLLGVVQRVPELWEGGGDDVQHRDTLADAEEKNEEEEEDSFLKQGKQRNSSVWNLH